MMRTAVLLLVACAVCVQGLGFVNPLLIPASVRNDANRLRLYRDLIYGPTNVETALPLRDLVLIESSQVFGVDPFDVAANGRLDAFNDPTYANAALATGAVVSVGPDVMQRDLFADGQTVIFASGECNTLLLSGQTYYLCPEINVLGAVDIADGNPSTQRFLNFANTPATFGGATPNLVNGAAFTGRDATFA